MTKVMVTEEYLENTGDAIREKNGSSSLYTPAQFASAIRAIDTSGNTGSKSVTANGTYNASSDNLDGYDTVTVNVPNSYSSSDEGKVVSSGALVAQTSTTKNANGTYDTTTNNSVTVNVPNSYAASDEGKVVSSGALVAQTSRSVAANGTYDTTTNNSVVVDVPTGGGSTLGTKTITQNGTYDAFGDSLDGYSQVTVNVSGGGGQVDWKDQLSVNWDFTNPVNTRGNQSYGKSGTVYTIDGWQMQGGSLTIASGGIKLARYASGTAGFFMQKYKNTATSAMVGEQFTLSLLVDGVLASDTFTMPSANSGTAGTAAGGVGFRVWNYGTEVAVTIDISADMGDELIQAIKLETGSTQTLATLVNGEYVLNNTMDADTEYIKARNGVVYNS